MTRPTPVLAWLALAFGFPQVLIGMLTFYVGGWWFLAAFVLVLPPFGPLILATHPQLRDRAKAAFLTLWFVSRALNVAVYGFIIHQFSLD